ncbi:FecR family protein [Pinibacter aurantiacus]|uniref:FecR domain-containing protein n=1 Tax=Pinibacter aurantiacus TaxID=2851599 RepID=A0A9E2SDY9_9BACT|nr:FecR domain-containing protein [Pinibacter aurantiacus]MBV4359919.1 FecR domain-containing protein [Pinibacter aurantiacus]
MNLSKEIVENFLKGNCSDEELKAITDALEADPGALDAYIDKSNWDEIGRANKSMPTQAQERINAAVMQHINKRNVRLIVMKYAAIAAAVIGVVFFISQVVSLLSDNHKAGADIAQSNAVSARDTVVENNSGKNRMFRLSDGSQVELSNGSSLRFQLGFTATARELYLEGQAWFNVATDKARPFTVYSGTLATTALGTSFTIKAFNASEEIDVTLHSGKVVIKQAAQKKDIFLLPGKTLVFNRNTLAYKVTAGSIDAPLATCGKPAPIVVKYMENALTFDREPLANVFKTLQTEYKTNISFDEEMLNGLSFTGTIPPTQPLKTVLDKIAFVNDLTITGTTTNYKVGRHN